jgi:hypothetical protein
MNSDNRDPELSKELARWTVSSTLPPNASAEVWRRIAHAEAARSSRPWHAIFNRLADWMPAPALSTAVAAVMLLFGAFAGLNMAQWQSAHDSQVLSKRYLQTVDPYQKGQTVALR